LNYLQGFKQSAVLILQYLSIDNPADPTHQLFPKRSGEETAKLSFEA